jgi:site-specific DNA recombinase
MKTIINIIIYCRKSAKPKNHQERKEENKILSLESQEKELKALALKNGFNIIKIFKENESAYKKGRPDFNEMISLLEQGKADSILVWHLTRISRNSYDGGRIIYLLDEGILKSIITPQKTYQNTGEDKFILSIELAMAKKSSDDTSSFVKRDIQAKADKGEFPGKAPLGYLNIDKEGRIAGNNFDSKKQIMLEEAGRPLKRIEIDPIDGSIVKQIFIEASKGIHTLEGLCDIAYNLGLRANRSGTRIVKASLHRMLTNPFYYGAFLWEGNLYTKDIKHEALITKELFDQVQTALGMKSFTKKEITDYMYPNLMVCGECESTISAQIQKGHRYYHCTHYKAKKKGIKCSQKKYYREEEIEEKLIELLKTVTIPQEFVEWGKSVIRENFDEEVKLNESQRLAQQNNVNLAKKKLHNLFQLKISPQNEHGELLSDEEYLVEKNKLQTEIHDGESILADTSQNERTWLDDCEEFFDFTSKLQEHFTNSSPEDKRIILQNIGKIVLNNGEMAFKLKEPYLYAAEIVKVTNSFLEISEPQKGLQIDNNPKIEPLLNSWRNGRDSNPRPPA